MNTPTPAQKDLHRLQQNVVGFWLAHVAHGADQCSLVVDTQLTTDRAVSKRTEGLGIDAIRNHHGLRGAQAELRLEIIPKTLRYEHHLARAPAHDRGLQRGQASGRGHVSLTM